MNADEEESEEDIDEEEEDEEEEEDSQEEDEDNSDEDGEEDSEEEEEDTDDDLNDGRRRRRQRQNVPGTERRHRRVDEEEEDDSEEGEEEGNLTANEEDGDAAGANATNAAGNDGAPGGGRNEDEVTNEDQQPATTGRDDEDDEEARRQREREQEQHDATNNREAQDAEDRADTFHDKAYAARRNVREIGDEAVWSVTSAKPGNGVELLRDGNLKTYWQSDGAQPHFINCQFQKKANVCEVAIYTNYKQDESYTPSKIVIRAGNSYRDLKDVATKTLNEPHGWQRVRTTRLDKEKLKDIHAQYGSKKHLKNSGLEYLEKESCEAPIRAFFIQICILQNHQNGRDTHVRQVHVYSPAATPASDGPRARFQSSEYARYAVVR
jgi:anaphase-promoting complex subunit 10